MWNIKLTSEHNQPVDVNAWVQRDDSLYGHPRRGRQSYFDERCYKRYDEQGREIEDDRPEDPPCIVKRANLVNAIATGISARATKGRRPSAILSRHDVRSSKGCRKNAFNRGSCGSESER